MRSVVLSECNEIYLDTSSLCNGFGLSRGRNIVLVCKFIGWEIGTEVLRVHPRYTHSDRQTNLSAWTPDAAFRNPSPEHGNETKYLIPDKQQAPRRMTGKRDITLWSSLNHFPMPYPKHAYSWHPVSRNITRCFDLKCQGLQIFVVDGQWAVGIWMGVKWRDSSKVCKSLRIVSMGRTIDRGLISRFARDRGEASMIRYDMNCYQLTLEKVHRYHVNHYQT